MCRKRRRSAQRLLVCINHVTGRALSPTCKRCRSNSRGLSALTLIGIIRYCKSTLEGVRTNVLRRTIHKSLICHRSAGSTVTVESQGVTVSDKSCCNGFLVWVSCTQITVYCYHIITIVIPCSIAYARAIITCIWINPNVIGILYIRIPKSVRTLLFGHA